MIIFAIIYVYVVYCFSLNYSGTDIPEKKQKVRSQQIVKRLKVWLNGGVWYEKNLSEDESQFMTSNDEKGEGGGGRNENEERG